MQGNKNPKVTNMNQKQSWERREYPHANPEGAKWESSFDEGKTWEAVASSRVPNIWGRFWQRVFFKIRYRKIKH
jgi:hypothetical protein